MSDFAAILNAEREAAVARAASPEPGGDSAHTRPPPAFYDAQRMSAEQLKVRCCSFPDYLF